MNQLKKTIAALTALICVLAGSLGFVVSAENESTEVIREMVVIGVDDAENPKNFFLIHPESESTFFLSEELVMQRLAEDSIAYGDIVQFHGLWFNTNLGGTNPLQTFASTAIEDAYITITGSIFEEATPVVYKIKNNVGNYITITTEEESYYLCVDYLLQKKYFQPSGVDWGSINQGDAVTMLPYKGIPCIPVELSPLGDVNADSTLNILDVILLNKAVLIGAPIPALETAARSGETDYGQCDFNGNGTLDLDDSLGMMKRIIGIEETTTE